MFQNYRYLIVVSIIGLVFMSCQTAAPEEEEPDRLAVYNSYGETAPETDTAPTELIEVYRDRAGAGSRVGVYWKIEDVVKLVGEEEETVSLTPGREAHIRSILNVDELADVYEVSEEEAADITIQVSPSFTITEDESVYLADYRYEYKLIDAESREILGSDVFTFGFVQLQGAEDVSKLVTYRWE